MAIRHGKRDAKLCSFVYGIIGQRRLAYGKKTRRRWKHLLALPPVATTIPCRCFFFFGSINVRLINARNDLLRALHVTCRRDL